MPGDCRPSHIGFWVPMGAPSQDLARVWEAARNSEEVEVVVAYVV